MNRRVLAWALLAGIIGLLWIVAYANRFVQDDAYISFRYADHWLRGQGLVWNAGERVEGYTNFLWVLLVAAGMKAGLSAPLASLVLGLLVFPVSLLFVYGLGREIFGEDWRGKALAAVLLTGANYTFSVYATGGLETSLQACLFLAVLWICLRNRAGWTGLAAALFSLVCAAGFLTRMDFALLAVFPVLYGAVTIGREPVALSIRIRRMAWLILPGLIVAGVWLWWKLQTYGAILPNTFHVKAVGTTSRMAGILYVYHFLASYRLLPVFALAAVPAVWLLLRRRHLLVLPACAALAWCLYVIQVGGCFMEFRLLVPVIPLIMLGLVWMIYESGLLGPGLRPFCLAAILAGSLMHMVAYRCTSVGIESVADLKADVVPWIRIGCQLNRDIGDRPVTIATRAAGAIGYYSRLPVVDEHGLSDAWVARHGTLLGAKPGHQRVAPLEYLVRRDVNLLIGDPMLVPQHQDPAAWYGAAERRMKEYGQVSARTPVKAVFLTIPLDGTSQAVAAWYLVPSPEVEAVIVERGWGRHEIAGGGQNGIAPPPPSSPETSADKSTGPGKGE